MNTPLPYFPLEDARVPIANIHPIKFSIVYRENGDGTMRAVEMVEWAKKGVTIPMTVVERVDKIRKAALRPNLELDDENAAKWRAIKPFYDNWKESGEAEITNGTPLSTWAGLTQEAREFFKPLRIFSVEDLAQASDSVLAKIPDPNVHRYRDRARQFLSTKDIAVAVRQLDERSAIMTDMQTQIDALKKALADANFKKSEVEEELEKISPNPTRKRKAG